MPSLFETVAVVVGELGSRSLLASLRSMCDTGLGTNRYGTCSAMPLFASATGVNFTSPATSRYAVVANRRGRNDEPHVDVRDSPARHIDARPSSWTECGDPCGTTAETSKLIRWEL